MHIKALYFARNLIITFACLTARHRSKERERERDGDRYGRRQTTYIYPILIIHALRSDTRARLRPADDVCRPVRAACLSCHWDAAIFTITT